MRSSRKGWEFSAATKRAEAEAAGWRCRGCGVSLVDQPHHFDHIIPIGLRPDNRAENCALLCLDCHSTKTRKTDIGQIAKAKRVARKHAGDWESRRPLPCARKSGWKKPLTGPAHKRDHHHE